MPFMLYVGINNPSLSLQLKYAILQTELYTEQINEIESLFTSILDKMNSPILTIPGMSYNPTTVIIVCFILNILYFIHYAICTEPKKLDIF